MMRIGSYLVLVLVLVLGPGCTRGDSDKVVPQFDPALLSGETALEEVRGLLAVGARDSGTEGARVAAEHLASRLEAMGLPAEIDEFTDPWPFGETKFRNVIGRLPGEGKGLIIIGSHYDTKCGMPDGFEGANDSGSSSGLLLEIGRVLAAGPTVPPEIMLVFFDGEECAVRYGPQDGLHGSRHLANKLATDDRKDEVLAVIVLDMIGDRDLTVTLPRNGTPRLTSLVFEAAHEEGVREKFMLYPYEIGDDHEPFLQLGMPAIDVIDFLFGSKPGANDYWHTAEDTLDKISAESLQAVGRVTLRTINKLIVEGE